MKRFEAGVVIFCIAAICVSACYLTYEITKADYLAKRAEAVFDAIEPTAQSKTLFCGEGSLCAAMFKEPFETVIFFFRDGSFLTYSTRDDKLIDAPISFIYDAVLETGRSIADCLLVVHNHFSPMGFSPGDQRSYEYLKAKGFHGVFGIYYPATGRFVGVEE